MRACVIKLRTNIDCITKNELFKIRSNYLNKYKYKSVKYKIN